jgi:hypothetical protein
MLRKTMIVLAMAAALTGGLTADAFARGGGGGGGGHGGGSAAAAIWAVASAAAIWAVASVAAIWAVASVAAIWVASVAAAASRVRTWPGRAATSGTTSVSVARVSGRATTTGAATATRITIPIAAICPRTDVRQHQRPPREGRTYDDTLCGRYYRSGSLGLRLCLCTSWRDEHLPWTLARHDISAWRGSRFAGRAS